LQAPPLKELFTQRFGSGRVFSVTIKEIAIHTIEELPEEASWADIQERINFVAGVRKGLKELDDGKGISHYQVREEFAEWLAN
jgi:hypothetical protein